MLSLVGLTLFNMIVLLQPPQLFKVILDLMTLPFPARTTLLGVIAINVVASLSFERWGTQVVAALLGWLMALRQQRRRNRDGKAYKVVEGGMR